MRKLFLMMLALCILAVFAFTGCDGSGSSDPVDPDFVLTTLDKDAIDTFTVPGIGLNKWTDSPCPIAVLVKNETATGNHYKKCVLNGYYAKNNSIMVPATYLLGPTSSTSAFKIQVECVREEQGLCCIRFSTADITDAERSDYVGKWNFRIGKASEYHLDTDDYVDNVLYEAHAEIIQ